MKTPLITTFGLIVPRLLTPSEQDFLATLRMTMESSSHPLSFRDHGDDLAQLIVSVASTDAQIDDVVGPSCLTPALSEWLSMSRQGISKAVNQRRIVGVQVGRTWYYPLWQLAGHGIFSGVSEVLHELVPVRATPTQRANAAAWMWHASPVHSVLGGKSVAQWLREGCDQETVVAYAHRAATRGLPSAPILRAQHPTH